MAMAVRGSLYVFEAGKYRVGKDEHKIKWCKEKGKDFNSKCECVDKPHEPKVWA